MTLANIRIVLVETTHPGNIGATARAMKTMGLTQLTLVNPQKFPHHIAYERASHADDILAHATIVDTLDEALADCQLVIGTSARPRDMNLPGLTPNACGALLNQHARTTPVALVFGRESTGLNNSELLKCQYHVIIPTNPNYCSLNLAAAVQVLAYEIRINSAAGTTIEDPTTREALATQQDIQAFYAALEQVLLELKVINPKSPRQLMTRLKRLFSRTQLEENEVGILRGILSAIQKTRS